MIDFDDPDTRAKVETLVSALRRRNSHLAPAFMDGPDMAAAEVIDELLADRTRLRDMLVGFVEVETDPCSFDHHGACQTHGWSEGPCGVATARVALKLQE